MPTPYQHGCSLIISSIIQPNEYTSTFDVHGAWFSSSGAMLLLTYTIYSNMNGEPTVLDSIARYELSSRERPKSDNTGCPLISRMFPSYTRTIIPRVP